MDNIMGKYKRIFNWEQYAWGIVIDTESYMYRCPACECRMIKKYYDIAVGTNGLNFCPYCGTDMRPSGILMAEVTLRTNGNIQINEDKNEHI